MQDLLPAGGLRLFREGVEPSGSLQKVSGYISILLLRPLPDASRVVGDVTVPNPHRPERARFDAFGSSRESFAHRAANGWTILAAGSGWRFRISFKRVHRTALPRSRRDNHFCQIRVTW